MNFSKALEALKNGERVLRKEWGGNTEWVGYVTSSLVSWRGIGRVDTLPWLVLKTQYGKLVPWQPSQIDILANDWEILK